MSASVIIDIILGVCALLTIVKFTIRGFVGSVLDTAKVFLAAILAYLLRIPVAKLFDGWFMRDGIVNWVRNSLISSLEGNDAFINFIDLYKNVPAFYNKVLVNFGLGDVSALDGMETASYAQVDALALDIGSAISMLLSTVLAVIAIFIISIILLSILVRLSDGLLVIASLSRVNRLLGFLLGIVVAFAIIWLTSFVLEFLVDVTGGFGGKLSRDDLNKSMLMGLVNSIL
ncbi:MAG: CvpA family protein [Clostridia bacterium]|nr:CvpA family protein [Clostridia bacterium]